jgi:hypothetical protein
VFHVSLISVRVTRFRYVSIPDITWEDNLDERHSYHCHRSSCWSISISASKKFICSLRNSFMVFWRVFLKRMVFNSVEIFNTKSLALCICSDEIELWKSIIYIGLSTYFFLRSSRVTGMRVTSSLWQKFLHRIRTVLFLRRCLTVQISQS